MKNLWLVFLLLSFNLYPQEYINIGSTKADVRRVQGEPTSVRVIERLDTEVWGYDLASVTFKNGKMYEYVNFDKILKIGDISPKKKDQVKDTSKKDRIQEIFDRIEKIRERDSIENPEEFKSLTGLSFGRSEAASYPAKYAEMLKEKGYNPNMLPDVVELEEMYKEYMFKKYLKYGLIILGSGILILIIRFIIKRI
jgi:hypothetical protein